MLFRSFVGNNQVLQDIVEACQEVGCSGLSKAQFQVISTPETIANTLTIVTAQLFVAQVASGDTKLTQKLFCILQHDFYKILNWEFLNKQILIHVHNINWNFGLLPHMFGVNKNCFHDCFMENIFKQLIWLVEGDFNNSTLFIHCKA